MQCRVDQLDRRCPICLCPAPSRPRVLSPESGSIREDFILGTLPRIEVLQGSFKPNATLVATLVDFDVPSELAQNIARLIQPVFDVRGFRTGNPFKLEKGHGRQSAGIRIQDQRRKDS